MISDFREIHEECGVFGIYNVQEAASLSYFGLHALQHRGQEASGICASDGTTLRCKKGKGLLTEVFSASVISELPGNYAVGHVKYGGLKTNEIEAVQPIMVRNHKGDFSIVHNGQIVNYDELKIELENKGSIFQGSSDAELIAHLIQVDPSQRMIDKIINACNRLEGSFAAIVMTNDHMYAIRDKNGIRPISIATLNEGYVVSSETCAFDIVGAKFMKDLEPGEIAKIDAKGVEFIKYTTETQHKLCAMEYIYFSRPDSDLDGRNVHAARKRHGKILARKDNIEADIVIGVPDSSLSAAIGYAEASGLPYEIGLIKNRYVGRTFIQPTQAQRERGVRMKLSAVRSIVEGQRVVMIDDSIVRGTTSKRIVQLLKEAGAKEVHVRIASPLFNSPCFYGVDTTTYEELIASHMSIDEIRDFIGADSLMYLTLEETKAGAKHDHLCLACFGDKYPTKLFKYQDVLDKKEK